MRDNIFKQGEITYTSDRNISPAEVAAMVAKSWKDGYIAFANGEKRLNDFDHIDLNEKFFRQRIQEIIQFNRLGGYVTELDLWRSSGSIFEEIAIEREENSYHVQHIVLDTEDKSSSNCWYRDSHTKAGSHHNSNRQIFTGMLNTIEVVWPEKRINIFVTVGE